MPKYTSMFFRQKGNQVSLSGTYLSESRNPISNYDIGEKYDLVVYQIDLAKDQSLKTLISLRNEKSSLTGNIVYSNINESLFEISLVEGKPISPGKIKMSYYGERFDETTVNDTLAYYNLNFRNVSLQYQSEGKVDFFLKTKDAGLVVNLRPLSILFLRRHKELYLFFLCPKSEKTSMDPKMLYNLVKSD